MMLLPPVAARCSEPFWLFYFCTVKKIKIRKLVARRLENFNPTALRRTTRKGGEVRTEYNVVAKDGVSILRMGPIYYCRVSLKVQ